MSPILGIIASGKALAAKAGYILGGYDGGFIATIQQILFSNETRTQISATLPTDSGNNGNGAGMSNNGTAGYFVKQGNLAVVKFNFAAQTVSSISATMQSDNSLGVNYENIAGYVAGGYLGATPPTTAIQKLLFSNETSSTISAVLSSGTYSQNGFNSLVAGYFGNGTTTDKLTFSTETRTAIASFQQSGGGSLSNGATAAYLYHNADMWKFPFSTEAYSLLSGSVTARNDSIGITNVGTAGYFPGNSTSIGKVLFSTDTISTISATMPSAIASSGGVTNC